MPPDPLPFPGLPGAARLLLVAALAGLLLLAGTYDHAVLAGLTSFWQQVLQAVGLNDLFQSVRQGTSPQVTTRILPVVATFSLGYIGICLLIVALLVPPRALRTALLLYAGALGLAGLLLLAGKAAGDVAWAYQLGRRLIDFTVSPLPVVGLIPLLRWHYAPPAQSVSR